ncbi:MAG: peptidoglycan-binding protein, partial [Actinomycetota bacterium]|nr:peptidoglycan-binding protein [Actinomycetota bacterium]
MHLLTLQQLCAVMPALKTTVAGAYLPELRIAMHGAAIDQTPLRVAAFLAQLAHESGDLRRWEEIR